MKKSLSILFGLSALALLVTAAPVLAAEVDVEGENNTTGADSDNDNVYDVDTVVTEVVDNIGNVDNIADDVNATTGDNNQNQNTTGGDLETGEVDATADWASVVNAGSGMLGAADGGLDVEGDFSNDTTGFDSDNDNDLDVDNNVTLDLDNLANVLNDLDFDGDTGGNDQNQNTTGGSTDTGDAMLDTIISNWANNDAGFAGAAGSEVSVDVEGENSTTGANSTNRNDYTIDHDYTAVVDNNATLDNRVDVTIDTGDNNQNQNTTGGDLETGNGEVVVDIVNSANNGAGAAGAASGNLDVSADFSNDTTGSNSNNDNDLDVDNNVTTTVNNTADVDNDVDVDVDTGGNDQNENTSGGSTDTGDANIDIVITNEVNS